MGEAPVELPAAVVVVDGMAALPAVREPGAIEAAELPHPPSAHAERFAAARRDPALPSALALRVAAPPAVIWRAIGVPLAMTAFGGFFLYDLLGLGAARRPSVGFLVPGVVVAFVWFTIAATLFNRARRRQRAPVWPQLAIVVARDRQIPHGHQHASALSTPVTHRATLELEDGRRLAVEGADDDVMLTVVEGDLGVAYLQADRLIGFRRLA